jgi:hypothetical protein
MTEDRPAAGLPGLPAGASPDDPHLEVMLEERARDTQRFREQLAKIRFWSGVAVTIGGAGATGAAVITYATVLRGQAQAGGDTSPGMIQLTAFLSALVFGVAVFALGVWLVLKGLQE